MGGCKPSRGKTSQKVIPTVTVFDKFSSELTFENFYPHPHPRLHSQHNARLILAREHAKHGAVRLRVWQKEFYLTYTARKRFLLSCTAVALLRVRRHCTRALRMWHARVRSVAHLLLVGKLMVLVASHWLLRKTFRVLQEAAETSQLETRTSNVQLQLLELALARRNAKYVAAVLPSVFASWRLIVVTIKEFCVLVPLVRENRVLPSYFSKWAASQFRATNFSPKIHHTDTGRKYLELWHASVQDLLWSRAAHKAFLGRVEQSAHKCISLAFLIEWYRFSAAVQRLRAQHDRDLMVCVFSDLRETYRVKSRAKRHAMRVGFFICVDESLYEGMSRVTRVHICLFGRLIV